MSPAGPTLIGIDVGEVFLDLAILNAAHGVLRLARVPVSGLELHRSVPEDADASERSVISELHWRLMAVAPELGIAGTIALIDSPRWPRALDLAKPTANTSRSGRSAGGRAIDRSLREIVAQLALKRPDGRSFRLSLFPTPGLEYFAVCAADPLCKTHLAAIARELFGSALHSPPRLPLPTGGRLFTRFMLAGFAVYRALEPTGAECFEAYPDLAFRLWAEGVDLPPKNAGRAALDVRKRINQRLADELGCSGASRISTLDGADAAILALSAAMAARVGSIAVIEHSREGRFALALNRAQTCRLFPAR
jgi:hypothetical protein